MKTFPSQLLWALLPAAFVISCKEGKDRAEKETDSSPLMADTSVVYNISAFSNWNLNSDVMFNRVPGDPEGGIVVREKRDSGTHHEVVNKGTVRRGSYTRENRAFVYSRYDADSGCRETAWYSWVNPSVEVARLGGDFTARKIKGSYKAATGLPFRFGEWNKDYQKKWVDSVNKARRDNGLPPLPVVSPNDSLKDGQPYQVFPTPEGDGFLDAPFFGDRTPGGKPSMAERLIKELGKVEEEVTSQNAPPNDTAVIRFTTSGITYLYCIERTPVCLGYYSWTIVETDTVYLTWVQSGAVSMDLNKKKWKPGTTIRTGSAATVGPWQKCP